MHHTTLRAVVLLLGLLLPTWAWSQALDRRHAGMINPLEYGSSCTSATLNAAISAAPATQRVLMLTPVDRARAACTWIISANVTIPDTMVLHVPRGALLSVNSGITITIRGMLECQPDQQCFAGAATTPVLFQRSSGKTGPVPVVWVPWFGWPGDGVTNGSAAFQAAANSLPATYAGTLKFPPGDWVYTTSPTLKNGTAIEGAGGWEGLQSTILRYTGTAQAIRCLNCEKIAVRNLLIQGTGTAGTIGIYLSGGHHSVDRVRIDGFTGVGSYGMVLTGSAAPDTSYFHGNQIWLQGNQIGLLIDKAGQPAMDDNHFTELRVFGSVSDGIQMSGVVGAYFDGIRAEGNATGGTGYGINILSGHLIHMRRAWVEQNGTPVVCGTRGDVWFPATVGSGGTNHNIIFEGASGSTPCNVVSQTQGAYYYTQTLDLSVTGAPFFSDLRMNTLNARKWVGGRSTAVSGGGGTFTLTPTLIGTSGWLFVSSTNATVWCIYSLEGGGNNASLRLNGSANCTHSLGTAGTINLDYSGGVYMIENNTAGALTFSFHYLEF